MRSILALVLLTLVACDDSGTCPPATGTLADVRTAEGTYDGYRVEYAAASTSLGSIGGPHGAVRVIGTGGRVADQRELCAALHDLESIMSVAFASLTTWSGTTSGAADCDRLGSTYFGTHRASDLDDMIEVAGGWLANHGYSVEVDLVLEDAACAL